MATHTDETWDVDGAAERPRPAPPRGAAARPVRPIHSGPGRCGSCGAQSGWRHNYGCERMYAKPREDR